MKMFKRIFAFALVLVLLLNTCLFVSAETESVDINSVVMTVGADETMRNITWFADCDAAGEVRYAEATEMDGDAFPLEYSVANAFARPAEVEGQYSYKATMRGLQKNTEYVYCIVVGNTVSKNYTFSVKSFDDDFSFTYVTDVQVVDDDFEADWIDTMNKILTSDEFKDSSILVSGGDQVQESTQSLYNIFINDDLSSIALAPSYGRLHDEGALYDQHFNLPNLSSTYGSDLVTADYYYTYNNVLFMHLNAVSADYEGHKTFLENAVATNQDCTWKIVVLHYSFFTEGRHSTDSRVTNLRDALAGKINELGVDLVLSGHDHVYVRSNLMLDATTVSEDVVTDNTVTDPEGTLYICGSKASYRNFYDIDTPVADPAIALRIDDDLKSAMSFAVTDESLTMHAYFLNGDTPVEFDNFTIYKTEDTSAELPDSYSVTYIDELGADFGDSTDTSLYAKRYFTTATPDEPRLSVYLGSLDAGIKLNWYWEYYLVDGDGTKVTELTNGNDYVAYLRCDTVKMSRNITIAAETNVSECIYTWDDAWELIYQYPGEAFTFTLSEDLTLSAATTLKDTVDLTVDLNGYTLTATDVTSYLLQIPKDGDDSSLKVISSKAGGVLNTGKKALSQLEPGSGSEITMQFGSADTYPITLTASTLVLGKSNFYNSTYNLSVYGGTYNFSKSIFDVRHSSSSTGNTYNVSIKDANINITGTSYTFVYQYEAGKYATADSTFNANNCVFNGGNTSSPKDFFGSDVWKGSATFTGCVFKNVVFDSALHTNLTGITFGENCVFYNYGDTFAVVTDTDETPDETVETEDTEVVPENDPIVYDFELYNNALFPDAAGVSGYKYSKAKSAVETAYTAGTHNWMIEVVADGVSTANNIKFFPSGNEGIRIYDVQDKWVALRIRVNQADNYELSVTGMHTTVANDYTADFWIIPATETAMTVANIESAMIDKNKLGTVEITTTNGVDAAGEYEFTAGEYILIMGINDDRMSFTNITLTPKEKTVTEEPPVDDPIEAPENTIERIPESENVLAFNSNKVTVEDNCYIVTLDDGVVAIVSLNSLEATIRVNEVVAAGGTLTYTVDCINSLPASVGAVITANIPENATFASADNNGVSSGSTVVWNVALGAGERTSVTFKATAGETDSFSSLAAVTVDNVRYTTNTVTTVLTEKISVQIGDQGYASMDAALAAAAFGDTIILCDDVSAKDIVLPSGVTIDLNGFTLTADSLYSYSSNAVVDNSENVSGLLKLMDADGNMISQDNSQLPVYDKEAAGYRFFAIDVDSCAITCGNKYWFKIKAEKFAPLYELICAESEVVIKAKMTWDDQSEAAYAAAELAFTKSWASAYHANEDIYITVSVTENNGVENFKLIPMITSAGVEITGTEM